MSKSDPMPPEDDPETASPAMSYQLRSSRAQWPQAPFEVSQEPIAAGGEAEEPLPTNLSPVPAYEHLGDLPPTYGSQSVYLVAYDPRQLFAYWDVDPGTTGSPAYGLRVCRGDGEVESEVAINPREAGRYLVAGVPGGTYYVELGTTGRAGRWRPLGFSGRVTMPPGGLAGETEPAFATLPFHLSFQRLLELIEDAMEQGEHLTATLARLQGGDQKGLHSLVGTLASLSQEQMRTLEKLLGHQVNPKTDAGSSFGGASENSAAAGAAFGSETLSSPGFGSGPMLPARSAGGELLSSAGAFGSETLASGVTGFGSETLASGVTGFGSETLASGVTGFGSETLASGAAGFGSETLAAGALGLSSESLSSFGLSESSMGILLGLGIDSAAWSLASGSAGMGSEWLSSSGAPHLFRDIEADLVHLSSMFSWAADSLSSDFINSESGVSSTSSGHS